MEYGGFWRRFAATWIDGLILLIPSVFLSSVLPYLGGFLCFLAYRPFFESSELQATPGKAIMGLAVVSEKDGKKITLQTAFVRSLLTFVSSAILFIGYIIMLFTSKKQTLHDIIAQTVVIRREPLECNYFQVWWYEVKQMIGYQNSVITTSPSSRTQNSDPNLTETHKLEELFKLYQSGAITEEEYLRKKEEILKRI
jgi:uncharacterized RDD family membrane protein YckC